MYLLVSQDMPLVKAFYRNGEQWVYQDVAGMDAVLMLPFMGDTLTIPLVEVYRRVDWKAEQANDEAE